MVTLGRNDINLVRYESSNVKGAYDAVGSFKKWRQTIGQFRPPSSSSLKSDSHLGLMSFTYPLNSWCQSLSGNLISCTSPFIRIISWDPPMQHYVTHIIHSLHVKIKWKISPLLKKNKYVGNKLYTNFKKLLI